MLTKPTAEMLRAIHSLKHHQAWREVDRLFEAELSASHEVLTKTLDEVTFRQVQGRAQLVLELQTLVRDVESLLAKAGQSTL